MKGPACQPNGDPCQEHPARLSNVVPSHAGVLLDLCLLLPLLFTGIDPPKIPYTPSSALVSRMYSSNADSWSEPGLLVL